MNIHSFFRNILFASLILCISSSAANAQLAARPVVFFNVGDVYERSLELVDIGKLFANNEMVCEEYNRDVNMFYDRIKTVLATIAKSLGACGIVPVSSYGSSYPLYVDPAYNITDRAIDLLNKEYLATGGKYKRTPSQQALSLYEAILKDSIGAVSDAIQAGADINQVKDGKTLLEWAVLYKRPNAIKILLQNGATATNNMFQQALKQNDIKSAVLLAINCGANLEAIYSNGYKNCTLLQHVANKLDLELVLLLIKNGASFSGYTTVNYPGWGDRTLMGITISHCGEMNLALELIQKFIDSGYKVNDIWHGDVASYPAWLYQNLKALELLIENGLNPNQIIPTKGYEISTWTPLFQAIDCGCKQAVKMLLDAGANINQKANPYPNQPPLCPNGPLTPLSFAINKGFVEIAELLRERGAAL